MKNISIVWVFLIFSPSLVWVQAQENFPVNGVVSKHQGLHAFINATIHLDATTSIKRGVMLVKDKRILSVGNNETIPINAIIHNLEGAHVYPSFIDPYTTYGQASVIASEWSPKPQMESNTKGPFSWNQALKPEFEGGQSFIPKENDAEEFRKSGFGTVLTYQNDGIVRGSSAVVSLGSERAQKEMLLPKALAHYSFSKGGSSQDYPRSFMGSVSLLRQSIYDAVWANHNQDQSNLSLVELHSNLKLKPIIEIDNHFAIRNVLNIADEFQMSFIIKGVGDEYMSLESFSEGDISFVLPLNFPKAFDVSDPYDCLNLNLSEMKHWELAPANAALLASKNISFAFTSAGLKNKTEIFDALKKTVKYGLSKEIALEALTVVPAKMLGLEGDYGKLKKGMVANFLIFDNSIFAEESILLENWVQGRRFVINQKQSYDYRGTYVLKIDGEILPMKVGGSSEFLSAKFDSEDSTSISFTVRNNLVGISYKNSDGKMVRLSGHGIDPIEGEGQLGNGDWVSFVAKRKEAFVKEKKKEKENTPRVINMNSMHTLNQMGEKWFPNMAYGWTEKPKQDAIIFNNVTLWTNEEQGILTNSSLAIAKGKIIAVGNKSVEEVKGKFSFTEVDGTGKHLTSGIIDEHSHIALRSVNEGTQSSSAEVRMADAIRPNDINIYRQLAGGVTVAQLLHGSANPIGGQSALIKMRWGSNAKEMLFGGAKPFIKFALGENVKQSNWGSYSRIRFPQTRMGVEQVFYDAFIRAREYGKTWRKWNRLTNSQKKEAIMPHKDLDLECLLEVLNDEREITCHSYRQSEINMLMHVADSMNFSLNTFTHVLEGYKVAHKMKTHGAGASTFSDWWAYKYEVNDAIPHNGALLNDVGVVTAFNSDDAEMARRLNQEAAKAIKYGGASEEDAWKFVTLNPAKLLHVDDRVGSLKNNKDADIVLWSAHPMSIYAKAEQTYVDGRLYYSQELDQIKRLRNAEERNRLIQKMLSEKKNGESTQKIKKEGSRLFHCDDE
jgi:imidazolonepropionase-like amidohydrolase